MKNKQTDYKSDGEYGYDQDPIAPAMPGQKKESPFAPVGSSKKPKNNRKKLKKEYKKDLKKALKAEKGTGSDYDGYTVKDHKRDMRAAGLKPFGGGKAKNKKAGTGNHPLNK